MEQFIVMKGARMKVNQGAAGEANLPDNLSKL